MDILICFFLIMAILISVVIYQSRKDKPEIKTYLYRFSRLIVILLNYFKEVGMCTAIKFRNINWDLTAPKTVPTQLNQKADQSTSSRNQKKVE